MKAEIMILIIMKAEIMILIIISSNPNWLCHSNPFGGDDGCMYIIDPAEVIWEKRNSMPHRPPSSNSQLQRCKAAAV